MISLLPIDRDVYKQYAERVNNRGKKERVVKATSRITKTRQNINDENEFQNSYIVDGKGKYIDKRI